MNGKAKKMFELVIMQKRRSEISTMKFYFEEINEMFDFIHAAVANARHETEYAIRVLEEGEEPYV